MPAHPDSGLRLPLDSPDFVSPVATSFVGRGVRSIFARHARSFVARYGLGWFLGASNRSSSSSPAAGTTNSSSSPASTGCSTSGT